MIFKASPYILRNIQLFLFLVALGAAGTLSAQTSRQGLLGQKIYLGMSPTLIINTNPVFHKPYLEFSMHAKVAVSLSSRFYGGLRYIAVFTRNAFYPNTHQVYFLTGPFVQYKLPVSGRINIQGELSWSIGNYCLCGERDPYKQSSLQYLGAGASGEYRLLKGLHLELGFIPFFILNKAPQKVTYTQYILGLNYYFGKSQSSPPATPL